MVYFSDERVGRTGAKKQLFQAALGEETGRRAEKGDQGAEEEEEEEDPARMLLQFSAMRDGNINVEIEDLVLCDWPNSFSICSPITILEWRGASGKFIYI